MIKIFEIGPDYVAAKNLRDAVREYAGICGESYRWILEEMRELKDEELDSFTFVEDLHCEIQGPERSFREQLAKLIAEGEKFPTMFASSEY